MLELYWLKAVIAIFEVVAFEAAFVADAERRRRELDIRNAKGPKKRSGRRRYSRRAWVVCKMSRVFLVLRALQTYKIIIPDTPPSYVCSRRCTV